MKIKKIEISNFRWIKYYNWKLLDFDIWEKLTILDWENGFWKTTIFDVIEFCFIGTVGRFKEIAKDNKPDTILKHSKNIDKESFVKIIFSDDTYISRIIADNQKWNLNDNENYNIEYTCDKSFLNINKSSFKNIFYVPQENPTELLKWSKDWFKTFLDILLDTSEEVNFKNNFKWSNKILKLIERKKSFLNNEIIKFDKLDEDIKAKLGKIKWYEIEDLHFISDDFIKNFNWSNISSWAYNKWNLWNDDNSFIKSWRSLLDLFQNKSDLLQYYINESISSFKNPLLKSKEIISNNYNYYLFYKESINEEYLINLETIFFKYKWYKSNLDLLKTNDKSLINIDILFKNLSDKDNYYIELNDINNSFNNLKKSLSQKSKNEKEYSDIFSNLIDFWENKFEKIKNEDMVLDDKNHTIKSDFCPLCMSENKKEDILDQLKFLKNKSWKIISESNKNFYSDFYSQELFNKLDEYVSNLEKEIIKVRLLQEYKKDFENFISLCKRYEQFDIDKISWIDFKEEVKIENKNNIIWLINNLILKLDDSYKNIENFGSNDYQKYKDIYFNLFSVQYSNKDNFLDNINQDLIANNVKYFENEFKKISNKEKNDLELAEKLNKFKRDFFYNRKEFLDWVYNILGKYSDFLDSKIKDYKIKKVNTIALPLYIFTQRIVKNYNWMWMILTENWINDEFNWKNPLFTLSSWQAEWLSLALMLSNNINFDFKFDTILIDDPIQSLDDLNILSFINLLRYQFSDKQIIISTHDEGFSRFIRYKFWRLYWKNSYKQINMKEKFIKNKQINYE